MSQQPVIALLGPTASGKSALAMALADRLPVSLISLDSAMIYREMNIGTAKPTEDQLTRYPHALVNIRNPDEAYSVGEFLSDAQGEIQRALSQNRVPILVGGTMMYFNALREGLSVFPEVDADIRAQLMVEGYAQGWPVMHERLRLCDPEAYRRIKPQDAQRITRALEVYEQTGRPFTSFWDARVPSVLSRYRVLSVALMPSSREVLHERIRVRAEQMLADGFLDEVAYLREKWSLTLSSQSMRSVGYRQCFSCLDGDISRMDLGEKITIATRQLAKRQYTWLRHLEGIESFDHSFDFIERVLRFVSL